MLYHPNNYLIEVKAQNNALPPLAPIYVRVTSVISTCHHLLWLTILAKTIRRLKNITYRNSTVKLYNNNTYPVLLDLICLALHDILCLIDFALNDAFVQPFFMTLHLHILLDLRNGDILFVPQRNHFIERKYKLKSHPADTFLIKGWYIFRYLMCIKG
jgi:hypothetical protein